MLETHDNSTTVETIKLWNEHETPQLCNVHRPILSNTLVSKLVVKPFAQYTQDYLNFIFIFNSFLRDVSVI